MKVKSIYKVNKMDCLSEEQLIRMKLYDFDSIKRLEFDIPERKVIVYHDGNTQKITESLEELNLDSTIISAEKISSIDEISSQIQEKKLLYTVLIINFTFFLLEMIFGIISKSMGLVADSLDMFADASVYGLSLYAVGGTITRKKSIAKLSGYFQLTLALIGFAEVIRRFISSETVPDFSTMIAISILALIANVISLYLLQKSKSKEAHMQASMIFTSNDIIVNGGVITAGILVFMTNSGIPDLLIGTIVFIAVMRGAFRIITLAK